MKAPLATLARYFWHVAAILRGRGAAARFRAEGNSAWRLALYALRAHLALAAAWGSLWRNAGRSVKAPESVRRNSAGCCGSTPSPRESGRTMTARTIPGRCW